ncbi:MAG TPA: NAD(P)/FAD-dependent oxidoreductase [Candidatus Sulfotelmatobacter sp.]|jgi:kynurenine 3-monooxygenase|nr:NAD(P)/FAD-dependent oxidoreductase [Candidatus Sulfotelmatobacter sp.]
MHNKQAKTITIIGSGIAGSFLSLLLAKRGYKVIVYEKLSQDEICDIAAKRSYNITILTYAIDMLKKAELWEDLHSYLLPLKGSYTQLSKRTKPIFTPVYDKESQYYAISRPRLLKVLMQKAEKHPLISFHYETALLSINRHDKQITVQHMKTKIIKTISCTVIIGADGVNSLVRTLMQQGQNAVHTQEYAKGGYKQFIITKKELETLQLENNVAYTWSGKRKFILAFPNFDGSLAALLVYPKNKITLSHLLTKKEIRHMINEEFPFLIPITNEIAEQLRLNPLGTFVTIHTDPWYYKNFIGIIGDAAHGFYPFFGQGASAAFGDSMYLVNLLDKYGPDWEKVFSLYEEGRKRHMDSLGELSKIGLTRYTRNKRADYDSIYDKLELILHNFLPKYVQPPVFVSVMNDPGHTNDYVIKSQRQRAIAKKLGIPFIVTSLTGLIAVYDFFHKKIHIKRF